MLICYLGTQNNIKGMGSEDSLPVFCHLLAVDLGTLPDLHYRILLAMKITILISEGYCKINAEKVPWTYNHSVATAYYFEYFFFK